MPTPLQLSVATTMRIHPKSYHAFQHLKPASQQTAKPSLDDMQNDSNKQLAAPEHARDNTFCSINWENPVKALETLEKIAEILFIIKFAHCHHLSARRHMCRIKHAETNKCPPPASTLSNQLAHSQLS
jgi:hypothetical protein